MKVRNKRCTKKTCRSGVSVYRLNRMDWRRSFHYARFAIISDTVEVVRHLEKEQDHVFYVSNQHRNELTVGRGTREVLYGFSNVNLIQDRRKRFFKHDREQRQKAYGSMRLQCKPRSDKMCIKCGHRHMAHKFGRRRRKVIIQNCKRHRVQYCDRDVT